MGLRTAREQRRGGPVAQRGDPGGEDLGRKSKSAGRGRRRNLKSGEVRERLAVYPGRSGRLMPADYY